MSPLLSIPNPLVKVTPAGAGRTRLFRSVMAPLAYRKPWVPVGLVELPTTCPALLTENAWARVLLVPPRLPRSTMASLVTAAVLFVISNDRACVTPLASSSE